MEKDTVHAYASGSGALSFVRRNSAGNPVQPSPSAEECIAYVRDKIAAGVGAWERSDWVIVNQGALDRENHGKYEAVRKVERVGDNELKMNKHVYKYDPVQVKEHMIPKFTFELGGRDMEIEGTGNNGALGYFLRNETLLTNPARLVWDSSVEPQKAELENGTDTADITVYSGEKVEAAQKAREAGLTIEDIQEFANVKDTVSKKQGDESLYVALAKAGVAMYHHETDLYVNVTTETKAILANFSLQKSNATTFKSNIDGALMYDIPFAYEPAWAKKLGEPALGDMKIADSGRYLGKVVDIANGYVVQNVGRGQLVIHDLKQLSQRPEVGSVMDVNYVEKLGQVNIVEQSKGVER